MDCILNTFLTMQQGLRYRYQGIDCDLSHYRRGQKKYNKNIYLCIFRDKTHSRYLTIGNARGIDFCGRSAPYVPLQLGNACAMRTLRLLRHSRARPGGGCSVRCARNSFTNRAHSARYFAVHRQCWLNSFCISNYHYNSCHRKEFLSMKNKLPLSDLSQAGAEWLTQTLADRGHLLRGRVARATPSFGRAGSISTAASPRG